MLDGREDGKYDGVSFVEVSKIFAISDTFFFGTLSFDGVYDVRIRCGKSFSADFNHDISAFFCC